MNYANLTPIDDMSGCPFPFFNEQPPETPLYKIYNDGGHYVATRCVHSQLKPKASARDKEDIDILFDSLYAQAKKCGLTGKSLIAHIKSGILKLFT